MEDMHLGNSLEFIRGDELEFIPLQHFDTVLMSNLLERVEKQKHFSSRAEGSDSSRETLDLCSDLQSCLASTVAKEIGLPYFLNRNHHTEYTQESFIQEMDAAGLRVTHMEIRWREISAEDVLDA